MYRMRGIEAFLNDWHRALCELEACSFSLRGLALRLGLRNRLRLRLLGIVEFGATFLANRV